MGEAKRAAERAAAVEGVTKGLANTGMLIEGGWLALKAMWIPKDAPPEQVRDLRWAFMAGAQHLFSSIMVVLDADAEPTDADMRRMDLISEELKAFEKEMAAALPVKGSA
jgi:hypothetical protein